MGAPSTHASTFLDLAARLRGLAASPRCGLRGWWMLGRRSESASLTFFGARSHDFRASLSATALTLTASDRRVSISSERKEVMWSGRCQWESKDPGRLTSAFRNVSNRGYRKLKPRVFGDTGTK